MITINNLQEALKLFTFIKDNTLPASLSNLFFIAKKGQPLTLIGMVDHIAVYVEITAKIDEDIEFGIKFSTLHKLVDGGVTTIDIKDESHAVITCGNINTSLSQIYLNGIPKPYSDFVTETSFHKTIATLPKLGTWHWNTNGDFSVTPTKDYVIYRKTNNLINMTIPDVVLNILKILKIGAGEFEVDGNVCRIVNKNITLYFQYDNVVIPIESILSLPEIAQIKLEKVNLQLIPSDPVELTFNDNTLEVRQNGDGYSRTIALNGIGTGSTSVTIPGTVLPKINNGVISVFARKGQRIFCCKGEDGVIILYSVK